jgi:DNA-binding response OmpR family regulator
MKSIAILLIEDDELDIISFERAIKKINLPITLYKAFNGTDALKLLEETPNFIPDNIVLDLNLPKMNGLEFIHELRKNRKYDSVKIFVMTISTEEIDRQKAIDMGVDGYMIKPLNFTQNTKKNSSMENFMYFQILNMTKDKRI